MADCNSTPQPIEDKAGQPRSVSGDQGSYVNHSLADQIEFDRYIASKSAGKTVLKSIYGNRYVPPDARGT